MMLKKMTRYMMLKMTKVDDGEDDRVNDAEEDDKIDDGEDDKIDDGEEDDKTDDWEDEKVMMVKKTGS